MLSFGDRVGGTGCILVLALFGAAACGGAASNDLADPAGHSGDDGSSGQGSGKDSGSGSGKGNDATVEAASGSSSGDSTGDATSGDDADDADDATDSGTGDEAPSMSACMPACSAVQTCCEKTGNAIFGRCYNPNFCFPLCCQ